jgi:hypothetical protein
MCSGVYNIFPLLALLFSGFAVVILFCLPRAQYGVVCVGLCNEDSCVDIMRRGSSRRGGVFESAL